MAKLTINGQVGRFDKPSYVFAENDILSVEFEIFDTRLGRHYASIRCGNRLMELEVKNGTVVEIPHDFIRNGNFEPLFFSLEFRNTSGAIIVPSKHYRIEPLYILRVEETDSVKAIAWFTDIESKIKASNERHDALMAKLEEIQATLDNEVPEQIKQAVNDAIVYLTNGDPLKS